MNKTVKLYNLVFPVWLLWIVPLTWIVVLPVNFLIDLLVVVVTMKYLKISNIKQNAKAVIVRVWLMGFAADFIGSFVMYMVTELDFGPHNQWWDKIQYAVMYYPFQSGMAIFIVAICIVLTAFCIYLFNYKWALEKAEFQDAERKKVALSLAVFTAPYLFYLPTEWFYR